MGKTLTKVIPIKSPIQIELDLNLWVETEHVDIVNTQVFTHDNKQFLLVTYRKNTLFKF